MEKQDLLYEGKSKKVYATNDPARLIVAYKDEKGAVNNHISNAVMRDARTRRRSDASGAADVRTGNCRPKGAHDSAGDYRSQCRCRQAVYVDWTAGGHTSPFSGAGIPL